MNEPIVSGQLYWVQVDTVRFQVKAVRAAALAGWWHCEGVTNGDALVVPEGVLIKADDSQANES
jgi:hypothetical protein